MNAHEPTMDDHETLPVPAEPRDVVPGDPVYDAELVDDPPAPTYVTPKLGRFSKWWLSWWMRSPSVPVWLKSRHHARQAARDLATYLLRAPIRFLGAVVRGLVAGCLWWRRWVTVRDFREAAEVSEKLADKFAEIRTLTLFRWKVTGGRGSRERARPAGRRSGVRHPSVVARRYRRVRGVGGAGTAQRRQSGT